MQELLIDIHILLLSLCCGFCYNTRSLWHLVQRVKECLRDICYASVLKNCQRLTYCGRGGNIEKLDPSWREWLNISAYCFESDKFSYGMFEPLVMLASEPGIAPKSAYSLFWGLQVHDMSFSLFVCSSMYNYPHLWYRWIIGFVLYVFSFSWRS